MEHSKSRLRGARGLGLWAAILLGLAAGLWGLPKFIDRPEAPSGLLSLRAAVAEGSELVAGDPGFPSRSLASSPQSVEPAPDGAAPAEGGKEPRPLSAIPLPTVLPTPRVDLPVSPDGGSPVPDGWSLKEFVGRAKVKVEKVGPLFAIHLNSDRASFGLHKDIAVDLGQFPYLTWAWRVDQLPPKGDVRQKHTDDQAAQLYVIFPRFPAMVRSQILGYIWDSTAPAGTVLDSPTNRMAKVIVLRSGTDRLGQWVVESRNVLEDFRRLFGEPPPKVGKISLLINSQNTKSSAESWFAGIVFTRSPLQHDSGMAADAMPFRAERGSGPARLERVN